jgi:hypothetical protein
MNFEADIEQFISDLPNKIEQAKRQLCSGNLNALEFWHRRIGDFLNVLNVLWQRFEESQSDGELIASLNSLAAEIHDVYARFEGVISTHADISNGRVAYPNYLPSEGTLGRPKLQITKEELQHYFDIYKSWKEVASSLDVSERTLQRRRTELAMSTSGRSGPRGTYSDISEDDLCTVIREILSILPNAGELHFWGMSITWNTRTTQAFEICNKYC